MTEETKEPAPKRVAKPKPAPVKPTCGACFYYERHTGRVPSGDCHRYPGTERKQTHHWCGEFKPGVTL